MQNNKALDTKKKILKNREHKTVRMHFFFISKTPLHFVFALYDTLSNVSLFRTNLLFKYLRKQCIGIQNRVFKKIALYLGIPKTCF